VCQIRTLLFAALLLTKVMEKAEGEMGRFQRTSLLLLRALWIAALLMAPLAHGQAAAAGPVVQPQTVVDILHQLSDKADVVFAGQVLAIRRPNDGVVEVEFRVDQAIRGCTAGTPYVVREWAGLWAGDDQRYRVGQRLLMLLHGPSAIGMSSPIGGLDGAIPIRQGGAALAPEDEVAAPLQPPYVDLRWIGAKIQHAVSYRSEPVPAVKAADLQTPSAAQQMGGTSALRSTRNLDPTKPVSDNAGRSDASVPAQQASVNAVIDMLNSWQRAQHAAP
jgi:hypothetical protein